MAFHLDVSIGPQTVFHVFGLPITNALLTGVVGVVVIVVILAYVAVMTRLGKYNRFVGLVQWLFESLLAQVDEIIPDKKMARRILPLSMTIFFVVLASYWLSVLPGLDSIRLGGVPLLRSLATDLNFTIALALITVVTVQLYAIRHLGVLGNIKRYIRNPLKDPIGAFEGALEIISEFSRGLALALRLFGNAFAGEILLIVIALLTSYAAALVLPIFMAFELFIGFIQAYVFFMLSLIFTSLAVGHEDAPAVAKE